MATLPPAPPASTSPVCRPYCCPWCSRPRGLLSPVPAGLQPAAQGSRGVPQAGVSRSISNKHDLSLLRKLSLGSLVHCRQELQGGVLWGLEGPCGLAPGATALWRGGGFQEGPCGARSLPWRSPTPSRPARPDPPVPRSLYPFHRWGSRGPAGEMSLLPAGGAGAGLRTKALARLPGAHRRSPSLRARTAQSGRAERASTHSR